MKDTSAILAAIGACRTAREWAACYPDPQEAWEACADGFEMLWYIGMLGKQSPAHAANHAAALAAIDAALADPRAPAAATHARLLAAVSDEGTLRAARAVDAARQAYYASLADLVREAVPAVPLPGV